MHYLSVHNVTATTTFRDAMFSGVAPDGGLYVPEAIPVLPEQFFEKHADSSLHSLGLEILSSFIDEIPPEDLQMIIEKAWDFPIPLTRLHESLFLLELFHGPTLAFKDVGARFMAHAMSYFLEQQQRKLTILVATSGDTGGAVANGFFEIPHIEVMILYPSGKISCMQERQITTYGGNITAVQVEGTFDDCQSLVRTALKNTHLREIRNLTTANSINIGRLLPQIVYYVWGLLRLRGSFQNNAPPLIVVPSGNLGNLTAAVYAKRMGTPIRGFVAAVNANDGVLQYLRSGKFFPRPSVPTYSSAMDVGNPGNLARVRMLYNDNVQELNRDIDAVSISDKETLEEVRQTQKQHGVILDPHTAVGVAAARKAQEWMTNSPPIIVAATAHPSKFVDFVTQATGKSIPMPERMRGVESRPSHSIKIRSRFSDLRDLLLDRRVLST